MENRKVMVAPCEKLGVQLVHHEYGVQKEDSGISTLRGVQLLPKSPPTQQLKNQNNNHNHSVNNEPRGEGAEDEGQGTRE